MQRDVAHRALDLARDATTPGTVLELDYKWAPDDAWKDDAMRRESRGKRIDQPQYQCAADAAAADPECPTCVWPARAA